MIRNSTRLARVAGELQPIDHLARHAHAFDRVVVVAPLADVVQQQRQHQQLRAPPARAARCGTAAGRASVGRRQPFEVADRQQRVLVDRVLVVEVAHHAPRDRLELREHAPEQPAVVHLRQARVEPGPRLEQLQQRRAVGASGKEVVGAVAIDVLLDARQRFLGDLGAGVDRRLERADPRRRVARRLDRVEEADAVARQPEVRPDRHRRRLPRPLERARDDAGVAEVVAHQPLDALARLGARVAEQIRRPLLHLVAEHVLVALGLEVQRRSDPQQKVLGVVEPRRIGRPAPQQQRIGQQRDRPRRRQVAQRARRFLDVRLQLVERGVEPRVPLLDQLQQRRQDVRVRRRRVEQRVEPVEQRPRAGHRPRVEQRQQELRVVGLELREVVELAHLMADDDAEVPERVQERAQEPLLRRADAARRTARADRCRSAGRGAGARSRRARGWPRPRAARRRRTAAAASRRRDPNSARAPPARRPLADTSACQLGARRVERWR